ncbi:MAG: nicotinate-nucleotide adenylyltransferase [Gammaproteobacteria bacterium]|nr:nicotinate-nucleotide adenylyltransferase [Gammaproteobacteria bacterium]
MICLFGGTFDPVHRGHIHGALTVCDVLELSQLRMVLSARPGHRQQPAADAGHRWRMLSLACDADDRLIADDRELQRDAPSYTVDTLVELRREAGNAPLGWVLGSDAFADLPSWHRWTEVLELTNLVILQRPGQDAGAAMEFGPVLAELCERHRVDHAPTTACGQIVFLEDEMPAISASEVRAGLAAGRSVDHLLPEGVATYITRHGLYGVLRDP